MNLTAGQRIECDVESLAFGGAGVARVGGMVFFIEDVLPGEKVVAEVTRVCTRFVRARALEILSTAAERRIPQCRYFGLCGGCHLQHLDYPAQVAWKRRQVVDLLERIGSLCDFREGEAVPSPDPYGYRHAIRLHRAPGTPARYGYYCRDNRSIVPVSRCEIALAAINMAIPELQGRVSREQRWEEVILHADTNGRVSIFAPGEDVPDVTEMLSGVRFSVPPASFFQANRAVAEILVGRLRVWLEESGCRGTLFDLFSGVGVFSMLLGDIFTCVVGIDDDSRAIARARVRSRSLAGAAYQFLAGKAEDLFAGVCGRYALEGSAVILDPPRTGVGEGLVRHLKDVGRTIERIFYVSCNPATLARDLKLLCRGGPWRLDEVIVLDMFPQTSHIETCCSIVRKEKAT
jgi:23S rRNA (uracil1939-C5)-methyltransferase